IDAVLFRQTCIPVYPQGKLVTTRPSVPCADQDQLSPSYRKDPRAQRYYSRPKQDALPVTHSDQIFPVKNVNYLLLVMSRSDSYVLTFSTHRAAASFSLHPACLCTVVLI